LDIDVVAGSTELIQTALGDGFGDKDTGHCAQRTGTVL